MGEMERSSLNCEVDCVLVNFASNLWWGTNDRPPTINVQVEHHTTVLQRQTVANG